MAKKNKATAPLEFTLENELSERGYSRICGIDEAGRGPLCGPVVAAACILPLGIEIDGLNDSKKLNERTREILFEKITSVAIDYSIASASVAEIDDMNILEATLLAMRRAVAGLKQPPDYLLVDGNVFRGFDTDGCFVVGGDAKSPSIAAASILAKVTRDRICMELDALYPQYGLSSHKGYGTKAHIAALREYGPSDIHRKKFIRFLENDT